MPRAGVTRERVTEEAEQLADEVGFDALTLAAVAVRLGIKLPSLYKHIDSLAALRDSVSERAIHELAGVMARATVGKAGADAVAALAHASREWAHAHPGRYAATVSAPRRVAAAPGRGVDAASAPTVGPPDGAAAPASGVSAATGTVGSEAGPAAEEFGLPEAAAAAAVAVGVIYDVLAGFGLEGDDAIDATRGLRSLLHGFVALEAAGGFGLPADVDRSFDRLVDAFIRSLPGYRTA
ncbi:WHG domain-containing protein [Herbiconiux sp. 11R-BC]|uniref:TetR/AcrR family transcriptional regulator n=1 Tax=Herbiconiux sp. 11R-BC TaxID=3111637 RepID=UPI003C069AE3